MVVDSVGFSRTTRAHGIVHFLSKMAAAREIMTLVLESLEQPLMDFTLITALLILLLQMTLLRLL